MNYPSITRALIRLPFQSENIFELFCVFCRFAGCACIFRNIVYFYSSSISNLNAAVRDHWLNESTVCVSYWLWAILPFCKRPALHSSSVANKTPRKNNYQLERKKFVIVMMVQLPLLKCISIRFSSSRFNQLKFLQKNNERKKIECENYTASGYNLKITHRTHHKVLLVFFSLFARSKRAIR